MPYKSEKLRLSQTQDRRYKLTDEQKEQIRKLYETGLISQRELAKQFNVNRSTIQIIINPDRAAKVKQRIKKHWKDYRPDKEAWSETMREHRHYKQELYLKGELKEEDGK